LVKTIRNFKKIAKMKVTHLILIFIATIFFVSCTNDEVVDKTTAFFTPDTVTCRALGKDTFTCIAGSEIIFRYQGDCDYITFWSGESGKEYINKDRISIPVDSAYLEFDSYSAYGNTAQPRPLSVYVSNTFQGNYSWVGINDITVKWDTITPANTPNYNTSLIPFPSGKISLSKYNGNAFYIAFKYVSDSLPGTVRQVRIGNFAVKGYTSIGVITMADTPTAGFVPVNIAGPSYWSNTTSALDIRGTAQKKEEDWFISSEIALGRLNPDKGMPIKTLADNISDFRTSYSTAGTYHVTIETVNSHYGASQSKLQNMTIIVK
jgi:hypothetical protein